MGSGSASANSRFLTVDPGLLATAPQLMGFLDARCWGGVCKVRGPSPEIIHSVGSSRLECHHCCPVAAVVLAEVRS